MGRQQWWKNVFLAIILRYNPQIMKFIVLIFSKFTKLFHHHYNQFQKISNTPIQSSHPLHGFLCTSNTHSHIPYMFFCDGLLLFTMFLRFILTVECIRISLLLMTSIVWLDHILFIYIHQTFILLLLLTTVNDSIILKYFQVPT